MADYVSDVADYVADVADYVSDVADYIADVADYVSDVADYIEDVADYVADVADYVADVADYVADVADYVLDVANEVFRSCRAESHLWCGGAEARGIEAEPPAKPRSGDAGDGADSPTRGQPKAARSGSPKKNNYLFIK